MSIDAFYCLAAKLRNAPMNRCCTLIREQETVHTTHAQRDCIHCVWHDIVAKANTVNQLTENRIFFFFFLFRTDAMTIELKCRRNFELNAEGQTQPRLYFCEMISVMNDNKYLGTLLMGIKFCACDI